MDFNLPSLQKVDCLSGICPIPSTTLARILFVKRVTGHLHITPLYCQISNHTIKYITSQRGMSGQPNSHNSPFSPYHLQSITITLTIGADNDNGMCPSPSNLDNFLNDIIRSAEIHKSLCSQFMDESLLVRPGINSNYSKAHSQSILNG